MTWATRIPSRRDHPRIRGEHRPGRVREDDASGIIPAYAGSTPSPRSYSSSWRGSSPHTRGAPRRTACRARCRWDHPRIRGEHWFSRVQRVLSSGIIPAYAGSTPSHIPPSVSAQGSSPHTRGARVVRPVVDAVRRDHPRLRGEHSCIAVLERPGWGIIPAYAGSTFNETGDALREMGSSPHTRGALCISGISTNRPRDHPRIRGEHGRLGAGQRGQAGIIPAYAGST